MCNTLADHANLLLTSLDIEKAYETSWIPEVIITLQSMNFTGNIIAFVKNFLDHHCMRVRTKRIVSKLVSSNGLPQGSVLSVILFIVTINHSLRILKSPLLGRLFVDDLTISCWGQNIEFTFPIMQKPLSDLQTLAAKCGLKFSASNSKYMIIGSQVQAENKNLQLQINNHVLQKKTR